MHKLFNHTAATAFATTLDINMALPKIIIAGLVLVASACSSYKMSVNDNVVYVPPTLFSEYHIPDAQLKECIRATIKENAIVKAEKLKTLHCSNNDVQSLEGLAVFSRLETLGLANNNIQSIAVLSQLEQLSHLEINNNKISDLSPLSDASTLVYLNIEDNPINCDVLSNNGLPPVATLKSSCEH